MADAATLGSPKDQKHEVGGILMADAATLGSPKDQKRNAAQSPALSATPSSPFAGTPLRLVGVP